MSELTRYTHGDACGEEYPCGAEEAKDGEFVYYDEVAPLLVETFEKADRKGVRDTLAKVREWATDYKENLTMATPITAAEHTVIGLLEEELDRLLEPTK